MINKLCEYRLLIGFMGEKHIAHWWDCSFLSSSSSAFLAPICPNSILTAQYNGVCNAASIVHDEHIGIGQNYHLFRLPDSIERDIERALQNKEFSSQIKEHLVNKESALHRLKVLGTDSSIKSTEGPVVIGDFSTSRLNQVFSKALSCYLDAFENNYKTFPYLRCT